MTDFFATLIFFVLIFVVVPFCWLMSHVYFIVLPMRAIQREQDPERLRRYLERVIATPSLFGPAVKLVAHGGLVGVYLPRSDYANAIKHSRAELKCLEKVPHADRFGSLEAAIRRKLADCLQATGEMEQAAQEFALATKAISRSPEDTLHFQTKAELLERQQRFTEAYDAHFQAYQMTPESERQLRIECLVNLSLGAYNAGKPDECERWAKQAVESGATRTHLRLAHRMAGIANWDLCRLDESEKHLRRAYEVSVEEKESAQMAETLCQLAECLRKRGRLVEANEEIHKALDLDRSALRMAIAVQSQIFRKWGKYDEALAALKRFNEGMPLAIPFFERRVQAVVSLDRSRIEAERGCGEVALRHLEPALDALRRDAKLSLVCEAAHAWVLAVLGSAEESRDVAAQAKSRLAEFPTDPGIGRGVWHDVAMAACARGDHAEGLDGWTQYLALNPDPVQQPTAFFLRGECHRNLNRPALAAADYQAAVDLKLETYHAQCARRCLSGLTFSNTRLL